LVEIQPNKSQTLWFIPQLSDQLSHVHRGEEYFLSTLRVTPTVPHPKLLLFFWQKQKKPSPTVFHLRLSFIPSWEKLTWHAHICTQRSAAHPPVLEEVEEYKIILFFLRIPDLSFQEVQG
jgi:hypothetical protein